MLRLCVLYIQSITAFVSLYITSGRKTGCTHSGKAPSPCPFHRRCANGLGFFFLKKKEKVNISYGNGHKWMHSRAMRGTFLHSWSFPLLSPPLGVCLVHSRGAWLLPWNGIWGATCQPHALFFSFLLSLPLPSAASLHSPTWYQLMSPSDWLDPISKPLP